MFTGKAVRIGNWWELNVTERGENNKMRLESPVLFAGFYVRQNMVTFTFLKGYIGD